MPKQIDNGNRLAQVLEDKNLNQRQLAHKLRRGDSEVSRWVNGATPIEAHRNKIAKVLGVKPQEIWPRSYKEER